MQKRVVRQVHFHHRVLCEQEQMLDIAGTKFTARREADAFTACTAVLRRHGDNAVTSRAIRRAKRLLHPSRLRCSRCRSGRCPWSEALAICSTPSTMNISDCGSSSRQATWSTEHDRRRRAGGRSRHDVRTSDLALQFRQAVRDRHHVCRADLSNDEQASAPCPPSRPSQPYG